MSDQRPILSFFAVLAFALPLVMAASYEADAATAVLSTESVVSTEATYGGELTFTSPVLLQASTATASGWAGGSGSQNRLIRAWKRALLKSCAQCRATYVKDESGDLALKVATPYGFSYDVTSDNRVLEVRLRPLTARQAGALTNELQSLIFDVAAGVGLQPDDFVGGGHIHIGAVGLFADDPVLFREFIVDLFNHADLHRFLGANKTNSPSLVDLLPEQREALAKFIATIDAELAANSISASPREARELVADWSARLEKAVYYANPKNASPTEKFQAIGLRRLSNRLMAWAERTLEMRFPRPQKKAQDYVNWLRMMDGRIAFLRDQIARGHRAKLLVPDKDALRDHRILDRLTNYLRPSGLKIQDMQPAVRDPEYRELMRTHLCRDLFQTAQPGGQR